MNNRTEEFQEMLADLELLELSEKTEWPITAVKNIQYNGINWSWMIVDSTGCVNHYCTNGDSNGIWMDCETEFIPVTSTSQFSLLGCTKKEAFELIAAFFDTDDRITKVETV